MLLMLPKLGETFAIVLGGFKNEIIVDLIPGNGGHRAFAPIERRAAGGNGTDEKKSATLHFHAGITQSVGVAFADQAH